jgi:Ca2+-binding RTX toxin-like protein
MTLGTHNPNRSENSVRFETLESRQLMAAGASVDAGVLRVEGTTAADRILVEAVTATLQSRFGQTIAIPQYRVRVMDSSGALRTDASGQAIDRRFSRLGISRIDIFAGAGGDNIDARTTAVPNKVFAGSGNDVIRTGSGHDDVRGELGNDYAVLGNGNDDFIGASGSDTGYGGNGNDELLGDAGNDQLFGQAGDDKIDGGAGTDVMNGSTGFDELLADRGGESLSGGERVKITVPGGSPQDDSWSCGPNSASRLLRSYGFNVSYSQMRSLVSENNLVSHFGLGTTPPDLESVMDDFRSTSRESGADFSKVTNLLGQGKPVIALIGAGANEIPLVGTAPEMLHYICLTGFDMNEQKVFYTDTDGEQYSMSFEGFQDMWNWPGDGAPYAGLEVLGVKKKTILW